MERIKKESQVQELKEKFKNNGAVILCDYRGNDVHSISSLRRELTKQNCEYKVYKNTLVKLAIAETSSKVLNSLLSGPVALIFTGDNPATAAKVVRNFAKENKNFQIKGGCVEGSLLDVKGVDALADMPGKDELRAKLLSTLMAPASGFVRVLNAGMQNFVYLLDAKKRDSTEE